MSTWTPASGIRMHARLLRPERRIREPIVMLHGLGVSAASLGPLAERLAERSTTLACDLPGFGRTAARGTWSTARVAAAVEEALALRGLGPVVLMGHSWGCQVAALLAARHPSRVSALVLLSPSFDRAPGGAPGHVLRLLADAPMERPSLLLGGVRDYLRAGPRRLVATLRDARTIHLDEVVAGIEVPILIVRGGRDPLTTAAWARRVAAAAPDARVAVVPRAAHGLGHEAPGAVCGAVSAFLESRGHGPRMSRRPVDAPADR